MPSVGTVTIIGRHGEHQRFQPIGWVATATTHNIFAVYAGNSGIGLAGSQSAQVAQVVDPIQVMNVEINQDFIPLTGASQDPGTGIVTLITDGASGFTAGNYITVAGYTAAGTTGYNGVWNIVSVTVVGNTNEITYMDPNSGLTTVNNFDNSGYALSANTTSDLQPGGTPGNGHQRSMVDSIVYTFNTPVSLSQSAVTLGIAPTYTASGAVIPATTTPTTTLTPLGIGASSTTWILTFNTPLSQGHSIADGVYTAAFDNTQVTAAAGGSTMTTTHATDTFYRFFGDSNGDGHVNGTDFARYNNSGLNDTDALYLMYLDFNGDGRLNGTDGANQQPLRRAPVRVHEHDLTTKGVRTH